MCLIDGDERAIQPDFGAIVTHHHFQTLVFGTQEIASGVSKDIFSLVVYAELLILFHDEILLLFISVNYPPSVAFLTN